ncbi:MAG: SDR family oxidoreductase [Patescibacteria group bacterium]|nr:SDR family oxidoreductase [Patescibacteria group bacterium]
MNILITGTGSGIGRYLAESLSQKGHHILELPHVLCDVSDYGALERWASRLDISHIDALIHCAGIQGSIGPSSVVDPREWSKTIDVDLKGPFYVWRAFHALLSGSKRPKVILFGGGGATKPRPNFSAYASAKAGVVRLAEVLANEHPGEDFFVIAPGAVRTKMSAEVIAAGPRLAGDEEYAKALKFDTKGLPAVLELVEFLLGPEGSRLRGRLIAAQWDPWRDAASGDDGWGFLRRTEPAKSP